MSPKPCRRTNAAVSDEVERSSVRSAVGKDRADDIVIGVGLVDEAFPLLVHHAITPGRPRSR